MDADHQKSAFASKRGVPKCPFGELYVLHFQTDDFFKTKSCGKQENALDYLYEKGYVARRSNKNIDDILKGARKIRKE